MLTQFVMTGKNTWSIRVNGHTHGRIEKRRGKFIARVRRFDHVAELDAVCFFVAELNAQR